MDEDYDSFEVVIKDSGTVYIKELGSCPLHYSSIEEAIEGIKRKMQGIQSEMHFESEHDPNEGP